MLDCRAFGGQAGASARMENYLGFPTGITGKALMARAYNQAQKFGVEMAIPDEAVSLDAAHGLAPQRVALALTSNERVRARYLTMATHGLRLSKNYITTVVEQADKSNPEPLLEPRAKSSRRTNRNWTLKSWMTPFHCPPRSRGPAVGPNPNSCGPIPDGRTVIVTRRLWSVIVTAIFWSEIAGLIHRHAPSPIVIPTATAAICGFPGR